MKLSTYRVRLPEFEGPLDALLFFVQREELPIEAIPIARLVEQFLDYLRWAEALDLELAAEFFEVAAELLLIKARWLLRRPSEDGHAEERGPTIGEAPEPLWEKLAEYRRYKAAAAFLWQRLQEALPVMFPAVSLPGGSREEIAWENAVPEALVEALQRLQQRLGRTVGVLVEELSVAQYVPVVLHRVQLSGRVLFSALVQGRSVAETVVVFLALLELVQRGQLWVEQSEPFADILVSLAVPQPQES